MVTDLRFTLLGSGTSSGVPVIGCDCEVCVSTDPRDRRLRCSACLEFTDAAGRPRVVLIDASPDLREQALRLRLKRCDAILFTHQHVDHIFGLDEVRRFNALMGGPIDVYAERPTLEALRRVYRHIFESENNVNPSFVATLIPHALEPAKPIEFFGLRVTPLRLLHGRLPILGFRFERAAPTPSGSPRAGPGTAHGESFLPLAYCTDTSAIPPETWPALRGLNTLFIDALRYRRHPTHFTVDQALEAAERVGARRTWLIHMTHDIRHADLDPRLPESVRLGYDGLQLEGGVGANRVRGESPHT